jgi:hypothetical protein
VSDNTDCDDTDATVYPDAPELCDGIDNNCNGQVEDDVDADGDGFTPCGGDCNDTDPDINPDACDIKKDGIDQDCDGVDRTKGKPCPDSGGGCSDDLDGDGYVSKACGGDDCNDADPLINPGAAEICGNTIDENCDGNVNEGCGGGCSDDLDGDGHISIDCGGDDCDDTNPNIYPGHPDKGGRWGRDGVDNDCSGAPDDG